MQSNQGNTKAETTALDSIRKNLNRYLGYASKKQLENTSSSQLEKKTALFRRLLKRISMFVLVAFALILAYFFLLVGEPSEDAKYKAQQPQDLITSPISALEMPNENDPSKLADSFNHPVLSIQGGVSWQKARIEDIPYKDHYARKVTIQYSFQDGNLVQAISIRPTGAISVITGSSFSLDGNRLYSIGSLSAARMDNGMQICIFAQSEDAAYALLIPSNHESELDSLIKQSALISPCSDD